jgi:hypothetical protein
MIKKNRDGAIDKLELKTACTLSGFPINDSYLNALFASCDIDGDEKINFVEFCNFLCFKESMPSGIDKKKDEPLDECKDIKDSEGRVLLKETELEHKFGVSENEFVPRTVVNQIDSKVGNWKTTYDIINEAPYRLEPLSNFFKLFCLILKNLSYTINSHNFSTIQWWTFNEF